MDSVTGASDSSDSSDSGRCEKKYHLCFVIRLLTDLELQSKLFLPGYSNCVRCMYIIRKICEIFHMRCGNPGPVPVPPKEYCPSMVIFKNAILYDQYLIDTFILPFVKYRLDYEFNLFIAENNDKQVTNINNTNDNNNYKNILYILEVCIKMQHNIQRIISKMEN